MLELESDGDSGAVVTAVVEVTAKEDVNEIGSDGGGRRVVQPL